jgi:hypothetical protein
MTLNVILVLAAGREGRMESAAGEGMELGLAVALLAAGVVAVPIFRRLGLGSVLGYLAAGLVVGPFGFGLFKDPQAILHVAELGVVMFLFLIGLEMRPAKLWALRAEIFGLGLAQVLVCGALLTGVALLGGLKLAAAVIAAMGFVQSSTAVIMKMLEAAARRARRPASASSRFSCWKTSPSFRCWRSSPCSAASADMTPDRISRSGTACCLPPPQ